MWMVRAEAMRLPADRARRLGPRRLSYRPGPSGPNLPDQRRERADIAINRLSPHARCRLRERAQFADLVFDGDGVADDRGGKAALRADSEALQGDVLAGLCAADAQTRVGFLAPVTG